MSSIKDFGNGILHGAEKLKNSLKNRFTSATDAVTSPIEDIKFIKAKNEEIKKYIDETDATINPIKEATNKKLEELGKIKIDIISSTIEEFTLHMNAIKNLPFDTSNNSDIVKDTSYSFSKEKLKDIQVSVVSIKELLKNTLEATATGAISAGTVYTAIAALGTASTSVSIAGLSGIATSNATLAWLGGGALAVGGGGMALGTIVLGGLAIIPALSYMAWKGKFNYQNELKAVESALIEAKQYANNAQTVIKKFEELSKFIDNVIAVLNRYNTECIKLNKQTDHIRLYGGNNYLQYTKEQQLLIQKHMLYLDGLLNILNSPIMNQDGSINKTIIETITHSNNFLNKAEALVFIDFKKKKRRMGLLIPVVLIIISVLVYFTFYYQPQP